MNEDLLKSVMKSLDPARDLSDQALDDLVPHARLTSKIASGLSLPAPDLPTVRGPFRRKSRWWVGAGAMALTIGLAGSVSIFGAAPVTTRLGDLAPMKVHKQSIQGTGFLGHQPKSASVSAVVEPLMRDHRVVHKFQLDGGVFTVTPPPTSLKNPLNAPSIEAEMWATSQLSGYSRLRVGTSAFGFGVVTITKRVKGISVVTKTPAWVGFAREDATYHCPMQTGGSSTQKLEQLAPDSGLAAVVIGQNFSPAIVYIAKSVRCGRLYPGGLMNATEKFSLPWTVIGKFDSSKLAIEVSPPPCGQLAGSAVRATLNAGSLTSVTIAEFGTVPDYTISWQACPLPAPVRKVIDLKGQLSSKTQLIHLKTGRMTTVTNSSK